MSRLVSLLICMFTAVASAREPVSFEREVLPLLEKRCNKCHNAAEANGGLDLTRHSTILRGGDELGQAVVAGDPTKSSMIRVLVGDSEPAMPENAEPLSDREVELLRAWIQQGAKDDTPSFSAEDIAFFEKEVRPVLFQRCFKCHAGDDPEAGLKLSTRYGVLNGGSRGPAIVPGDPEASLLLKAVRHLGELQMPRGGDRLTDREITSLAEWIRRGVPWPADQLALTRKKLFTISDADRNHWAFRPLPRELSKNWSIDEVLGRRFEERGLEPSKQSSRTVLLRRLTYDLIGFPPTSAELEAFRHDDSQFAYEKVVDRLLASPLFGRRWSRHWLDYTRNGANGSSNRGPEMDPVRYADWVARRINEDQPYDWFVRVHLAGDRMPTPEGDEFSLDQAYAAAVPLNGPRTFARAELDTFVLMDKLDEGIGFMGRSLMGISLECARCHDHKFDPISRNDYYSLLGFFQSSWFGPVDASAKTRVAADESLARYRGLMKERSILEGRIRRAGTKINIKGGGLVRKWQAERQKVLATKERRLLELELEVLAGEISLAKEDDTAAKLLANLTETAVARKAALKDFKPRYFDVRTIKEIGYEIHGHKSQLGLIARANSLGRSDLTEELKKLDQFWWDESDQWGERQRYGGYLKTDTQVAEMSRWDDESRELSRQLEQLQKKQVVVRCEGGLNRAEDLKPLELAAKEAEYQFYPEQAPPFLGDSRLLRRGDVLEPDQLVPRGYPQFFGGDKPKYRDSGRLALANWLTKPESLQAGLVARAAVNRVWQHLYGEGICRTPKELGRLGHTPEVPELVDGLAVRFIASGWSTKTLVKEIVMSESYQRSSMGSDRTNQRDPQNRFFARQAVRRLDSDAIMNSVAYFREGVRFETPEKRNLKLPGYQDYLERFDGPTTDDIVDRRTASISSLQALFLMNNGSAGPAVARAVSKRLGFTNKTELTDVLDEVYRDVLQRDPTPEERKFAERFVERRRAAHGAVSLVGELTEFVHVLLCSNEFIYIE